MHTRVSTGAAVAAAAAFLGGLMAGVVLPLLLAPTPAHAQAKAAGSADKLMELAAMETEMAAIKGQLPDQSHAMSDVAQHFANLWFAAQNKNWPLAKFYLDETRSHLNWAVRLKPIRKTNGGLDLDLRGILQSVENTQLKALKAAVDGKDSTQFAADYRQTLEACYACHKAAEKPYLRPHVPEQPDSRIINFDPEAKWPE